MIIKSMGRKGSKSPFDKNVIPKNTFRNLVDYMTRGDDQEKAESVIWNGFYGHPLMSNEEIIFEFDKNAKNLKKRKNGNVMYHEIISFGKGYDLGENELKNIVVDIGHEYLRKRAPRQMAFGAIHFDTDHIHLHFMISANAIGKAEREWMKKSEFSDIQKYMEAFVIERYPRLAQTKIYDREKPKEKIKTKSSEQSMKSRTKMPSRKETIKALLHGIFERANSLEELRLLSKQNGIEFYERGKSIGIIHLEPDGTERRHRLSTLGLDTHYEAMCDRLRREASFQKIEEEPVSKSHSYTDPVLQSVREDREKPKER